MKTNVLSSLKFALLAALVLATATIPALAQTVTIGRCEVTSVDTTNMAITVQTTNDKETFTLYVTSRTRLFRNGEPAITADFQPGDIGHGSACTNADNKVEAVRFSARPAKVNETQ